MESKIKDAIKGALTEANIDLLDVKLGEEDGEKTLFITIDKVGGVNTDVCIIATKIINLIIDSLNLDLEDYILDVGSKGE